MTSTAQPETDASPNGSFGALPLSAIDMHTHVWPPGLMHPSQKSPTPLAAGVGDLLPTMMRTAVDHAVIIPASIHEDNAEILRVAAASPGSLKAVVALDPWAPHAVDDLARYVHDGAVGVRIAPRSLVGRRLDELGALGSLLDAADELSIFVQWTVTLAAAGVIELAAARRPTLAQIVDHLALPADVSDLGGLSRIRALADLPGVLVKLSGLYALSRSAYPYRDTWPWAEGVVDAFGPTRVLWASDWPLSTESADYQAQLAIVDLLPFIDAASGAAIRSQNAQALLGLQSAGPRGSEGTNARLPTW